MYLTAFGTEAQKLGTILKHENRHGTPSPLGDSADQYQTLEALRTEARTMLDDIKRQVAKELQVGLSAGADPKRQAERLDRATRQTPSNVAHHVRGRDGGDRASFGASSA